MAANPSIKLDPKYDHYDFPTTSPTAQSGHPGHTTPEQDAQVEQLRLKLEAAGFTERLDTLTLVCLCCAVLSVRFEVLQHRAWLDLKLLHLDSADEVQDSPSLLLIIRCSAGGMGQRDTC